MGFFDWFSGEDGEEKKKVKTKEKGKEYDSSQLEPKELSDLAEEAVELPELKEVPSDSTYLPHLTRMHKADKEREDSIAEARKDRKKAKDIAEWLRIGDKAAEGINKMIGGAGAQKLSKTDTRGMLSDAEDKYRDAIEDADRGYKDASHKSMLERVTGQQEIRDIKDENRAKEKKYRQDVKEHKADKKVKDKEIKEHNKKLKDIDKHAEKQLNKVNKAFDSKERKFDTMFNRSNDLDKVLDKIQSSTAFNDLEGTPASKEKLLEAMEDADSKMHARDLLKNYMQRFRVQQLTNIADETEDARADIGIARPETELTYEPKSDIIEVVYSKDGTQKTAKIKAADLDKAKKSLRDSGYTIDDVLESK